MPALLPRETNSENPRLWLSAQSMAAVPKAPDWEMKAMLPGCGAWWAKEALMVAPWRLLISPRQLGPSKVMPDLAHF